MAVLLTRLWMLLALLASGGALRLGLAGPVPAPLLRAAAPVLRAGLPADPAPWGAVKRPGPGEGCRTAQPRRDGDGPDPVPALPAAPFARPVPHRLRVALPAPGIPGTPGGLRGLQPEEGGKAGPPALA